MVTTPISPAELTPLEKKVLLMIEFSSAIAEGRPHLHLIPQILDCTDDDIEKALFRLMEVGAIASDSNEVKH